MTVQELIGTLRGLKSETEVYAYHDNALLDDLILISGANDEGEQIAFFASMSALTGDAGDECDCEDCQ